MHWDGWGIELKLWKMVLRSCYGLVYFFSLSRSEVIYAICLIVAISLGFSIEQGLSTGLGLFLN